LAGFIVLGNLLKELEFFLEFGFFLISRATPGTQLVINNILLEKSGVFFDHIFRFKKCLSLI